MPLRQDFIDRILQNDRTAVARAISMVENEHADGVPLLNALYPFTGRGYRVGITGPPGAGKSTITNKLAQYYRTKGHRVGIIAVDPTSPFTGGALLGDRIRMTEVELDEGVFIRSMASRGSLGGLSKKAKEAADVLDASGCDYVLMETVGVGQSELDIVRAADTTIVVLVPESGDSIQAMKAGLMEIADFFVLNKADRAGAEQAAMSIQMVLRFKPHSNGWMPDVLQVVASEGKGIDRIATTIDGHRNHMEERNELAARRRERLAERIRELIGNRLRVEFWTDDRNQFLAETMTELVAKRTTPYEVVDRLIRDSGT